MAFSLGSNKRTWQPLRIWKAPLGSGHSCEQEQSEWPVVPLQKALAADLWTLMEWIEVASCQKHKWEEWEKHKVIMLLNRLETNNPSPQITRKTFHLNKTQFLLKLHQGAEAEVTSWSEIIKKFTTKGFSVLLLKSRLRNFQLDSQPQNKECQYVTISHTN